MLHATSSAATPRPPLETADNEAAPARGEVVWMAALCGLMLLARVAGVFYEEFSSDEPQHLHVIWSWTQGLVQYRDIFDNHPPLFHLLMLPFVRLIGERADILLILRLALIPVFLAGLWATYAIARALLGRRAAFQAAFFSALIPVYFFRTLEFRPDGLWVVFWLLAILVLIRSKRGWKSGLAAGLLLGAAAGLSQKTALMLPALGGAALLTIAVNPTARKAIGSPRALAGWLAALACGLLVIPGALAIFFASIGAWKPLVACLWTHNVAEEAGAYSLPRWLPALPVALAALAGAMAWLARRGRTKLGDPRATFLTFAAALYAAQLPFMPVVEKQTHLPYLPLLAILAVLLLCDAWPWVSKILGGALARRIAVIAPVCVAAFCTGGFVVYALIAPNRAEKQVRLLGDVLRMTAPEDYVLDAKGEAVFRRRPIYAVLETLTKRRMKEGKIPDPIPAACVATGTCAAVNAFDRFPPDAIAFVKQNFLSVGLLCVAGKEIGSRESYRPATMSFEVAIPAEYVILAESGAAAGSLDGTPCSSSRTLPAGRHTFEATGGNGRFVILWAQAARRGFIPPLWQPPKRPD